MPNSPLLGRPQQVVPSRHRRIILTTTSNMRHPLSESRTDMTSKSIRRFWDFKSMRLTKRFVICWVSFEAATLFLNHLVGGSSILRQMFGLGLIGGLIIGLPIVWQTDTKGVPLRYWIYRYFPLLTLVVIIYSSLMYLDLLNPPFWAVIVFMGMLAALLLWILFQLPRWLNLDDSLL